MSLSSQSCKPCSAASQRLSASLIAAQIAEVEGWRLAGSVALVKEWQFTDFASALAFVNRVSLIAEAENHHPDITFGWGYAKLTLTTHALDGISQNDFILAAKINELGQ